MSWMAQEGDANDQPRRQAAHPNARAGQGCPWATEGDVDQFARGPPSSRATGGNPINHTGYQQAMPPPRSAKGNGGRNANGAAPWALEENPMNHFAAPRNAIGAGLPNRGAAAPPSARSNASGSGYMPQEGYAPQGYEQSPQQGYPPQGYDMPPQGYPEYAQPIEDDEGEDYGYGMPPQQYMQQQQPFMDRDVPIVRAKPNQSTGDGSAPWAQTYKATMQSESRAMYQGQASVPQQSYKPQRGAPQQMNNENYNLLHDATGGSYQKTVEAKVQHDAIVNQGHQAVADSRAAAAAIKNRMRGGENVLTWQ